MNMKKSKMIKQMSATGKMVVKNVNDSVKEVFDITGLSGVLTIE
mgnify:CR=1 FL=1